MGKEVSIEIVIIRLGGVWEREGKDFDIPLLSEFVAHHMCASIAIVRIIMKMRSENCCRPYEEGGKSYMGEENLKLSRSKINFYIGDVRAFLKRMSDMALGLL